MKRLRILIVIAIFFSFGCESKEEKICTFSKKTNLSLKFEEKYNNNGVLGSHHYVLLHEFCDDFFRLYNIDDILNKYLESIKDKRHQHMSVIFMSDTDDCGFETTELKEKTINSKSIIGFSLEGNEITHMITFHEQGRNFLEIDSVKVD